MNEFAAYNHALCSPKNLTAIQISSVFHTTGYMIVMFVCPGRVEHDEVLRGSLERLLERFKVNADVGDESHPCGSIVQSYLPGY